MSKPARSFRARAIPDAALRRLRSTPSYFLLSWRWSMWFYALVVILFFHPDPPYYQDAHLLLNYSQIAALLLTVTLLQTLGVTLYAPVFQVLLSRILRREASSSSREQRARAPREPAADEEFGVLPLLGQTRSGYWNAVIYGLDTIICGLVVYFSGPFTLPPFGAGSPFYRYGLSTAIAAALVYRYRGGLAAALGFDLFLVLGMIFTAPGASPTYQPNVIDIVGSLIDAPLAAILAAYLMTLLGRYAESKRKEQEQGRQLRTILRVSEALMKGTSDQQELLQRSVTQIRRSRNFDRLIITLLPAPHEGEHEQEQHKPDIHTHIEVEAGFPTEQLSSTPEELIQQVLQTGQEINRFEQLSGEENAGYGVARLYIHVPNKGTIQIVLGAESRRSVSFGKSQADFLHIVGSYLLVALNNLRLTEQASRLATLAERGRIAREIHDGIAQLIYMLSLHAETCEAQVQRIAEASEEDAELLTPLAERLGKLVTISKQALWETRNYMFSLKPLISGRTTLTQMLTNQLREFEAISDLSTSLHIEGAEELPNGDEQRVRRYAQVGTALFRIVQEALTNAYKHAQARHIEVHLKFEPAHIAVEVHDDGHGLPVENDHAELTGIGTRERFYSGYGMVSMQERARELGGSLKVISRPMSGMIVSARIPL